jgi:hypothetical protein
MEPANFWSTNGVLGYRYEYPKKLFFLNFLEGFSNGTKEVKYEYLKKENIFLDNYTGPKTRF